MSHRNSVITVLGLTLLSAVALAVEQHCAVINPDQALGWAIAQDGSAEAAAISFELAETFDAVSGVSGKGGVHLIGDGDNIGQLITQNLAGQPIAAIKSIKYTTFSENATEAAVPYLAMTIDTDGADAEAAEPQVFFFIPNTLEGETVESGAWQTWVMNRDSVLYTSDLTTGTTLDRLQESFPEALFDTFGVISGGFMGTTKGLVDTLEVEMTGAENATDGDGDVVAKFDFEPACLGARFVNVTGSCDDDELMTAQIECEILQAGCVDTPLEGLVARLIIDGDAEGCAAADHQLDVACGSTVHLLHSDTCGITPAEENADAGVPLLQGQQIWMYGVGNSKCGEVTSAEKQFCAPDPEALEAQTAAESAMATGATATAEAPATTITTVTAESPASEL